MDYVYIKLHLAKLKFSSHANFLLSAQPERRITVRRVQATI